MIKKYHRYSLKILCVMSLLSGCSVYKEDFAEADKHIPYGLCSTIPNGMVEVIRQGDAWLPKGENQE